MSNNHRSKQLVSAVLVMLGTGLTPLSSWSFDSGSTGRDGAFSPIVDTALDLPSDGVLNFTTVNIPAGVTVTFNKNAINTPVTLLADGDIIIDGTIDISGGDSAAVGAAGDGNTGDDGMYGTGGPGGFDGGRGGIPGNVIGAAGLGPGAGNQSRGVNSAGNTAGTGCGGSGAGYLTAGKPSQVVAKPGEGKVKAVCDSKNDQALGGKVYGVETLLPLVGGSGGGGGSAGTAFAGSGGGGGGRRYFNCIVRNSDYQWRN